jgi:hypothetical protein
MRILALFAASPSPAAQPKPADSGIPAAIAAVRHESGRPKPAATVLVTAWVADAATLKV